MDPFIYILGCDTPSGFGYSLAKRLDSLGMRVFAGCLDSQGDGARQLEETTSDRLTTVQLDITKDDQVEEAVKRVHESLNEGEGKKPSNCLHILILRWFLVILCKFF